MQGCLGLFFLLLLLSVWQYVLPPVIVVLTAAVIVCAVNAAGSLTALLVVPRTAERWLRLIGDCNDPAQLRTIGERYSEWRSAHASTLPRAIWNGLVVGFAWGCVLAAFLVLIGHAYEFQGDLWLVLAAMLLAYAAAAGRASLLNTVMRQHPHEHGFDAVTERLRHCAATVRVDGVTADRIVAPASPSERMASCVVAAPLSPQPRFGTDQRVRHVDRLPPRHDAATARAAPPQELPAERAGATSSPELDESVSSRRHQDREVGPSVPSLVTRAKAAEWRDRSRTAPAALTCGSCGRAISVLAGCACS